MTEVRPSCFFKSLLTTERSPAETGGLNWQLKLLVPAQAG